MTRSLENQSSIERVTKRPHSQRHNISKKQPGNIIAIRNFRKLPGKIVYLVQREGRETESWESEDEIDNLDILNNYHENVENDSAYTIIQMDKTRNQAEQPRLGTSTSRPKLTRLAKIRALLALKQQDSVNATEDVYELHSKKRKLGRSQDTVMHLTTRTRANGVRKKTKKQINNEEQAEKKAKRLMDRATLNADHILTELNHTYKSDCCLTCSSGIYRNCLERDDLEGFKTAFNNISSIPHYTNEDAPNGLDLVSYAITLNKPEFVEIISQAKSDLKAAKTCRPLVPTKYTTYTENTGHNNRGSIYSHRSFRNVQELRGNRLGNSAFYKGAANSRSYMVVEDILYKCKLRSFMPVISKDIFQVMGVSDLYVNCITSDSLSLYFAVSSGNRLLSTKILEQMQQNTGRQTFNHLHNELLKNHIAQELSSYKRSQILKMAFDACNLTPYHCSAIHPSSIHLQTFYEALDAAERLQTDSIGRTVAFYAAVSENSACLEYLISVDFNIQQHDKYKMTPFIQAARMGRSHNVELIIKHLKNTEDGSEISSSVFQTLLRNKRTALHYGAYYGHAETCKILVNYGAPIDIAEKLDKQTPLHYASRNGYLDCVRVLIEEGKADPEKGDKYGRNALHLACIYGQLHVVRYLLAEGVDANMGDTSLNRPAHYAAAFGYIEILHLLLTYGQADPTVNNVWRSTPCSVANMKGHVAVVRYLLNLSEHPINVNFKDQDGRTMLQHCIQESVRSESEIAINLNKAALLLSMNADANSQDIYGNSSLHLLAMDESYVLLQPKGWFSIYPTKLEGYQNIGQEATVKTLDDICGIEYQIEIAKMLLKSKADMYLRNRQNETPFICAMANNHHLLVATFLEAGYNFLDSSTDVKGNNFYHYFGKLVAFVNSLRAPQEFDSIVKTRFIDVTKRIWRSIENALSPPLLIIDFDSNDHINAVNDNGYTPLLLSVLTAIDLQKKAVTKEKKLISCAAVENTKTSAFGSTRSSVTDSWVVSNNFLKHTKQLTVDLTLQFEFYISIMESFIKLTKPNPDLQVILPKDFDRKKEVVSKILQYPRYTGYTALHLELLLKYGAHANTRINIRGRLGDTPMNLACHQKTDERQELPNDKLETLEYINKKFDIVKPDFCMLLNRTIKILLDYGASPYATGEKGKTPVMIASSNLYTDILRQMCYVKPLQNESINSQDDLGHTALMAAVDAFEVKFKSSFKADTTTVELLLENEADVNMQYNNTDTVFFKLIKLNCHHLIKTAIRTSVINIKHNYQNRELETALTLACRFDQRDTLKTYLEGLKSASIVFDTNIFDKYGSTPLSYACKHGNADVVEQLLSMGADPNFCQPQSVPLNEAVKSGKLQILKSLLRCGADVTLTDLDENTSLHHSVLHNQFRMVDALLEYSADCNRSNIKGQTALHLTVERALNQNNRSFRIERSLIDAGANINAADFLGRTPLHYAFIKKNYIPRTTKTVLLLPKVEQLRNDLELEKNKKKMLENYISKYTLNDQIYTENVPDTWLIEAAKKHINEHLKSEDGTQMQTVNKVMLNKEENQLLKNYVDCYWEKEDDTFQRFDPIDILQYLLNCIDLNYEAEDIFGRTPIHYAACVGAYSCTTLLIQKGININTLDEDKNGPLQLALLNNHVDYSMMLCSNGASAFDKITLKDLSQTSTLDFALSRSIVNIAYLIMNKAYPILPFVQDALINGKFHMAETLIQSADRQILSSALIKEKHHNLWHVLANFKPFDSEVWDEYLKSIMPLMSDSSLPVSKDVYGRTPVHYAAMHGQNTLLLQLLSMGTNVNSVDEDNLTELEYAVESGSLKCVKILLEAGAVVTRQNNGKHKSALLKAAEDSQLGIMRLLLEHGAASDDGDSFNGWSNSVMVACLKENIDMLQLLIKFGCDVNTSSYIERKDDNGVKYQALVHPIFISTVWEKQLFLKTLLEAGANPNVRGLEAERENSDSCFIFNARLDFVENQELLLDYGVALNDIDVNTDRSILYTFIFGSLQPPAAQTPIHHKARLFRINSKVFTKILRLNPSLSSIPLKVNHIDKLTGMTPLEFTIRTENRLLTEFLLSHGADVNAQSFGHTTCSLIAYPGFNPLGHELPAFLHALLQNNMDIITLVLEKSKRTINWLWQDEDNNNVIYYLIGGTSGYSRINMDLMTSIVQHYISFDILGILLTMKNQNGLCPLDYAYRYNYQKFYKFFVDIRPQLRDLQLNNDVVTHSPEAKNEITTGFITSAQIDEDANNEREKLRKIVTKKKKKHYNGDSAKSTLIEVDPYSNLQVAGVVLLDQENECPYDIMLMKVELNSWGSYTDTTFYKLSIIYNTVLDVYVVWTRWGPFGQEGQNQKAPYLTKEEAVCEFKAIFKSKTGNSWGNHQTAFEIKPGRYEILKTYHYPKDTLLENFDFLTSGITTSLPIEILNLMKLICNYGYLSEVYLDTKVDMPLGQIPQARIEQARKLLQETVKLIDKYEVARVKYSDRTSISLSKEYAFRIAQNCIKYSQLIPHAGINNGSNVLSLYDQRRQSIRAQLSRIDDISYVGFAANVILAAKHRMETINPLDYAYRALNCALRPVRNINNEQAEYQMVKYYMESTAASDHYELIHLLGVDRADEEARFRPFESEANRKLLWHGSCIGNFMGILKQGLRISPRTTTTTNGAMLGNGVYFADTFAKSLNYSTDYSGSKSGYADYRILLLCEVALGSRQGLYINQCIENCEQYDSVLGQGKHVPDPRNAIYDQTGMCIPIGPCVPYLPDDTGNGKNKPRIPYLYHNEYAVYTSDRVKIRYLLILKKSDICHLCGSSNDSKSLSPLHSHELKDYKFEEFNAFEAVVLKAYLTHSNKTIKQVFDNDLGSFVNMGYYKERWDVPLGLTTDAHVCKKCANHITSLILVKRMESISDSAGHIPQYLRLRSRCKYGKECHAQRSSMHHAKTYQHWFLENLTNKPQANNDENKIDTEDDIEAESD
ncbi:ankyrin repeat-containing domain protein [Mycotypha africana]|uniref:ankyrin repeat-containing domain protein n=1 Tax=Mycotypha africana TaxID=64632 RepID=UPI0023015C2F|nr:ankyrin repeat-containing domain protein [Mycotypha africana]KAI8979262.1 ankyrin repeat-containing domain protein [Mycotypha africana]